MDLQSKKNATPLTIELTHEQMWCYYSAIKQVLKRDIPNIPSDVAFLSQMKRKVKENIDKHKATGEYENTLHKITLNLAQWIGGWHCVRIILENKLYSSKSHEINLLATITLLGAKIQEEADRPERKLTLVK